MSHERKSLIKNRELVLGALALSLSIIFLGLSYVLPFSALLTIVFIPFLVAIFAFNSSASSKLVFMLALTAVCFIDVQEGFFYLWPNAIIGLLYGTLIKHKVDRILLFLVTTAVSSLLAYGAVYPINYLFQTDLFAVFAQLFNLDQEIFKELIAPVFFLLIGLVETLIMHLTVTEEMKKFKIPIVDSRFQFGILLTLTFVLCGLTVGISFINLALSYVFLAYALINASILAVYLFLTRSPVFKSLVGLLLIVSVFVALGSTAYFKETKLALSLLAPVGAILLSSVIFVLYVKLIKKETIELFLFADADDII